MTHPPHRLSQALIAILALLWTQTAAAATFNVTKATDSADGACDADCSLREAIIAANASAGADDVVVPAGTYVLELVGASEDAAATGDLDVTDDLTVIGADPGASIVKQGSSDRVIHVLSGRVVISGLSLENGAPFTLSGGGGIRNQGTLTLINSRISGNTANDGGGILNSAGGALTLADTTISGNLSTGAYGFGGGGITNRGAISLTSCTISGNTANNDGGGILNLGDGTATLTNTTISQNTARAFGGGISRQGFGAVTVTNTIIAGNTSTNCSGFDIVSLGHSLDDDGSCWFVAPGDISSADSPGLGPLHDNGSPTRTHALLFGSPAIDAGDPSACPSRDQRGVARADGDGDGLFICDMGAYERPRPQSGSQQKCINAFNKNFAKVARAQRKANRDCIRDFAKDNSLEPASTVAACLTADREGRVARAKRRLGRDHARHCIGRPPDFGPTDPNTVTSSTIQKEIDLTFDIFGIDLASAIIVERSNEVDFLCQQWIIGAANRCLEKRLSEFNTCKRSGLRNGSIRNEGDLLRCLDADPKRKVAKVCDPDTGRVRFMIDLQCDPMEIQNLLFPGCATGEPLALATCLDVLLKCHACLMLNQADGLGHNCDRFDDGIANESCS